MPYQIPTRSEILARILADFRLETGADPLRRSPERGLAVALMGQSRGQYGVLEWVFRQMFVDSADEPIFWRWAAIYLNEAQKPAVAWQGTGTAIGVNGALIEADSTLTRLDGQEYKTVVDATISGGEAALQLIASGASAASHLDAGQVLTFSSPIPNVDPDVTIASTITSGADAEDADDALVRLLLRLRTPPSGGGPHDYERWALEVPGVTRAWEFPLWGGPNTVGLAFVRDDDEDTIIPDADERAEVQTYVDSVAPVTVDVIVLTLDDMPVDITITNLTPDTPAVRAAIETSLLDFFAREAEPGATLPLSRLDAAISAASGEVSHVMTQPSTAPVATALQMPVLGDITYA